MDKLLEALALLLGHTNRDEVVGLVETKAAPLFQSIFQKGHDVGYGKKHGELDTAKGRVAELETANAKLVEANTALKANPDTASLHRQYGEQIASLTATHKTERENLMSGIRGEREIRRFSDLLVALTSGEKPLVKDYAEVLTQKGEIRKRIKINDDGSWQVLQKGQDIPVAAQTPEAALALLAEELKAEAPPAFILVGADSGGGAGKGAPGRPATGGAAQAAAIRDSVKATVAKETPKPRGPFAALNS